MRQNWLLIACGGLFVVALLFFAARAYLSADRELTVAELVDLANNAPQTVEREQATVELGSRGAEAIVHLRKLSKDTSANEVRAAAFHGLGTNWDFESMDALLTAMEDESPIVRSRAGSAVARMLSRDRRFPAYGTEEERSRIVGFYREDWELLKDASYFEEYKAKVKQPQ